MKQIIFYIVFVMSLFHCSMGQAEDDKVVIPTTQNKNYALYPAATGVFLRLDTRNGTIEGVVPSAPKKSRILNSQPLSSGDKPGRYELHPTDTIWEWLLFDTTTGNIWLLKWSDKHDILTKIDSVQ